MTVDRISMHDSRRICTAIYVNESQTNSDQNANHQIGRASVYYCYQVRGQAPSLATNFAPILVNSDRYSIRDLVTHS